MNAAKPARVWMLTPEGGAGAEGGCRPCLVLPGGVLPEPRLVGDAERVQSLLRALRAVRNPKTGADIVSEGWVGLLSVGDGEAELGLWSRQPGCHALQDIAEDAFAVLRAQLPDTDLYVRELRD